MHIIIQAILGILLTVYSVSGGAENGREKPAAPSQINADNPEPKFTVDKNLFPYAPHYLTLRNGARIHYIDEGKGPILLLLHGNPTWSFLYRHMVAELKSEFRLIAPDYPGFGLSSAPSGYGFTAQEHAMALAEFVERLGLRDITLVVQDWGGPIGFDLALRYPGRVHGFVIGNTWAWPLERTGPKMFSILMGGWIGQSASWMFNGVERFFMWKGVETGLSEAVLAMYRAPFEARKDPRADSYLSRSADRRKAFSRQHCAKSEQPFGPSSAHCLGIEGLCLPETGTCSFRKSVPEPQNCSAGECWPFHPRRCPAADFSCDSGMVPRPTELK